MYILYTNASDNTPSYADVSAHVVWRVLPPGDQNIGIQPF